MNRCDADTKNGERCKKYALKGDHLCEKHKKLTKCENKVCLPNKLCNPASGRCVNYNGKIGQSLKPKSKASSPLLKRSDSTMSISPESSPVQSKVINKINLYKIRNNILTQLQYDPSLINVMDGDGFVPARFVYMYDLPINQVGKEIEVVRDEYGYPYLRAIYGWKGPVAMRVMYNKFIPYRGENNIFCMSHVSIYGLGELNFSRRVNVLETPDKCVNKGVRAFVNIAQARKKGLEFWSKVGDRYGNKIYCFDNNLNENFFKIEYHDKYGNEEVLKITHGGNIEMYAKLMGGSHERALKQVKKLFITEDSD